MTILRAAPFPRSGLCCPPLSAAAPHRGIMRALTPADLTRTGRACPGEGRGLSAYSALPSRHSARNHARCPPVALAVASAPPVASRLRQGKAGSPQPHAESGSSSPACAGAGSADCRFTSGCSPPRLAATQLPSIAEPATGSGTDLHHADKASSRTHLSRRKAGAHMWTAPVSQGHGSCDGPGRLRSYVWPPAFARASFVVRSKDRWPRWVSRIGPQAAW
jgi:hypothetical protein